MVERVSEGVMCEEEVMLQPRFINTHTKSSARKSKTLQGTNTLQRIYDSK